MDLVKGDGYRLNNMDATITAQAPKLAPQLPNMREKLAAALEASVGPG